LENILGPNAGRVSYNHDITGTGGGGGGGGAAGVTATLTTNKDNKKQWPR